MPPLRFLAVTTAATITVLPDVLVQGKLNARDSDHDVKIHQNRGKSESKRGKAKKTKGSSNSSTSKKNLKSTSAADRFERYKADSAAKEEPEENSLNRLQDFYWNVEANPKYAPVLLAQHGARGLKRLKVLPTVTVQKPGPVPGGAGGTLTNVLVNAPRNFNPNPNANKGPEFTNTGPGSDSATSSSSSSESGPVTVNSVNGVG